MADNEMRLRAEMMYKKGAKLIDIANVLGVSSATIRTWKNRYKWVVDVDETFQKEKKESETKKEKRNVSKKEKKDEKKKEEKKEKKDEAIVVRVPSKESIESLNESSLNERQKLFCIYYIERFNATQSYMKAFGSPYGTAAVEGCKLLKKPKIKEEIARLSQEALKEAAYDTKLLAKRLLDEYIKIAFANIDDYLEFGKKTIETKGKDGKTQEFDVNYVDLKDHTQVDGSIITEVKQGKDGISIKLADKMKAMEFLRSNVGLLDLETRTKLALEIEKVKGDKSDKNQLAEAAKKVNARMSNNTKSDDKTE